MRLSATFVALALGACAGAGTPRTESPTRDERIWVLAPHPDDEVLMAGGTILRAVRDGTPVEVVVMTNGDLGCGRDGWRRQDESVAALAVLGLDESHVHFLGYPDGWLDALGATPLGPFARTSRDGSCGEGSTTYGARGAEHGDVHSAWAGRPATYTEANLLADLVHLLEALPPTELHLPHAIDTHPDHATTYALARRALERAHVPPPLLVRHVVHAGPAWPSVDAAGAPVNASRALTASALPHLPPPLERYAPDRVLEVGPEDARRWYDAIAAYESQLDGPAETSWLTTFARTTEPAFLQPLAREGSALIPRTPPGLVERNGNDEVVRWRAPVEASAELAVASALTLGPYRLTRDPSNVCLAHDARSLTCVALPQAADLEALSVRVVPGHESHAEIEIVRAGRVLGGAVDAAGTLEGDAGPGIVGTARALGLAPLHPDFDGEPLVR